ncbi:MAG: nuclear transport factor 2 family protein [Acidobacteriota bacterium]|nr:nuclear transport factor 2 family protein [Acidobacteriota bacterium]
MRHLIKNITVVNRSVFSPRLVVLLFMATLLLTDGVHAQSKTDLPAAKELYERIAALDAALFDSYNACDIDKVGTFFTEDLEFYHEKGGLTLSRKSSLDIMRTNLCGENSNRVRRELVRGSLEVHPISNYGAVETGEHRFYLTQKGQKEKLDGIGKLLWHKKDVEWKI